MENWFYKDVYGYFEHEKTLKSSESGRIELLRHKDSGNLLVMRSYTGGCEPYSALIGYEHRNLPLIYEAFQNGDTSYVLEEYLAGQTIDEILRLRVFGENETVDIISQVCDALTALHSINIIHRDIKPDNIMLLSDGSIKLFDFGASRIFDSSKKNDTVVLGTFGYAAPEQYGIFSSDGRADLFSVGVAMNVMLTGMHPSRSMYGGRLGKIINKCTDISPSKRYQSAQELKSALKYHLYT